MKEKGGRYHNKILITKKGGYGEIGRRYGLNWIEPWYGNLPSDNFQIQRNPGIKNGQSWAKSCFPKTNKGSYHKDRIKKDRCRDSMEAVLTNGWLRKVKESFHQNSRKDKVKGNPIYIRIGTEYICIGTEILSQMIKINKDPNPYFWYFYEISNKIKKDLESIPSWRKDQILIDKKIHSIVW